MTVRDLNHTWNCRHSFSCCVKSPDTTLSPGIILLWGLMVTHCPIYQNKTVLCNLASLLLCNHQYIRSKKKKDQLKACWGPGLGMCCALLYCSLSRKAWQIPLRDPAGHAIPINLSHWWTTASKTWHWWPHTCTPVICIIPNATGLQLDTESCGLQSPTPGCVHL